MNGRKGSLQKVCAVSSSVILDILVSVVPISNERPDVIKNRGKMEVLDDHPGVGNRR